MGLFKAIEITAKERLTPAATSKDEKLDRLYHSLTHTIVSAKLSSR